MDPCRSFKFIIEERLQCPSGEVAYNRRSDYILSLNIPLDEATNKEQLEASQKMKGELGLEGKKISGNEIVRPRVPLEACLSNFSAPEEVHDFHSTTLNANTTAIKTAGLATFPDYLILHMRKFVMEAGWVSRKLDVYLDVPDTIDISHMRSKGLQPGEELLTEAAPSEEKNKEIIELVANVDIVRQLAGMGFNYLHCQKAAINTSNSGIEEALTWLLSHMEDPDMDNPISSGSSKAPVVDKGSVQTLVSFGFHEDLARRALKASGSNIEKATDWIFSNPGTSDSAMDTDSGNATASSSTTQIDETASVPDGSGKYKLVGMVSHMGRSTHWGHYVAHVVKNGRWVIFNDSKVAESVDPPKDMAYLYFFKRY